MFSKLTVKSTNFMCLGNFCIYAVYSTTCDGLKGKRDREMLFILIGFSFHRIPSFPYTCCTLFQGSQI